MSDLLEDEDDQERTVTLKRDQIRALEKQAKQATEALSRAEAAERKLAFAEAGITLNDPKLSYFVKGYDGEFTPEAIRQAATDAGFIGGEQKSDDQDALNRVNATEAGASTQHVSDQAAYLAEMDAATSADQVTLIAAKYGRLSPPQ